MKHSALVSIALAMVSTSALADFQADPTYIVTTLGKGTLAADVGTMPVPAAAEPIVDAFRRELSAGCREVGGKPMFKPDFATAVDVNGDARADLFMTANRMHCEGAVSFFHGSSGATAKWALSKSDGSYAVVDQLHHRVEIQETLRSGYQLIVHLHGMNCGKSGASQCRHVASVDRDGRIRTVAWPDGKDRAIPDDTAPAPARVSLAGNLPPPDGKANSGWSTWLHNGSTMALNEKTGRIVYQEPKRSIAATAPPGTVLFEGDLTGNRISGTAYVFKRGCAPAPYPVTGRLTDNPRGFGSIIVLTGQAPKRDRNSCAIIGVTSAHSRLVFEEYGDV